VTVFGHAETDSGPDRSLVALVAGKKVLEERSDSLEEAAIGVVRIVVVRAVVVTRAVVGLVTIGLRFAVTATVVAVIGRRIVVAPVLTRSRFRIVDGLFVRVVTVLGFPRVVFGFVIFGLVTLGRVPVISLVALGLVAIVRLVIDSFVAIVRLVIVGLVAFVGLVPTAGPVVTTLGSAFLGRIVRRFAVLEVATLVLGVISPCLVALGILSPSGSVSPSASGVSPPSPTNSSGPTAAMVSPNAARMITVVTRTVPIDDESVSPAIDCVRHGKRYC